MVEKRLPVTHTNKIMSRFRSKCLASAINLSSNQIAFVLYEQPY